jgi:hypothetical protein
MDGTRFGDFWEVRKGCLIIALAMPQIPDHTPSGILPPFLGDGPDDLSALMSPYRTDLQDFIVKFNATDERKRILAGYLDHRKALREIGIKSGFQWLDGSFADKTAREPNDIDVVTFFVAPPDWSTPGAYSAGVSSNQHLFDRDLSKKTYRCDAVFVRLDDDDTATLVELASYWLGLFSHQKETFAWRGIVSVRLDSFDDDAAARELIGSSTKSGVV